MLAIFDFLQQSLESVRHALVANTIETGHKCLAKLIQGVGSNIHDGSRFSQSNEQLKRISKADALEPYGQQGC